MELIEHKHIDANGLKLHVAETGTGPSTVLFLHGFPEIWYSWRHQMIAVAKAGYRAIAPDFRGYGLSDPPAVPEEARFSDLINDLPSHHRFPQHPQGFYHWEGLWSHASLLIFDSPSEEGHWSYNLGYTIHSPNSRGTFRESLPEGFYVNRWAVYYICNFWIILGTGRAEADFGRLDAKTVVRNVYILFSRSELPIAGKNEEIMDLVEPSVPLPPWLTEEDLAAYGALYENSGFRTALKVPYRSFNETFTIEDPKVDVPALLVMGEKDYVLKFPGMEDYVRSEQVKYFAPNLDVVYIPEGTHFVQEQFPDQVNQLIINFLGNHRS